MRSLSSFHVLNEGGSTALVFTFDDASTVKALQTDDGTLDAVATEILPCPMPVGTAENATGWWAWWADVEEGAATEAEEPVEEVPQIPREFFEEAAEPNAEDIESHGDNPFAGPTESPLQAEAEPLPADSPQPGNEPTREMRQAELEKTPKQGGLSIAQLRKRATGPLKIKGAGKLPGGRPALIQAILDREAELGLLASTEAVAELEQATEAAAEPVVEEELPPEPDAEIVAEPEVDPMAAKVAEVLAGAFKLVKPRIEGIDDLILLRAVRLSATRKGVLKALDARIVEREDAKPAAQAVLPGIGEVEHPDDNEGDKGFASDDGDRETLGGGIGSVEGPGEGTEIGGFGGTGGELGGGLGDGSGEVRGGLAGEGIQIGENSDPEAEAQGVKKREGAGCKQPDKVHGWEAGKVMCVVKKHRGAQKDFGLCEYRVRCEPDGGYKLILLQGNRHDLSEGQYWPYVSDMLTDLMCIPRDADGKPNRHHRMTLKRWFRLGMGKSAAQAKETPAQ